MEQWEGLIEGCPSPLDLRYYNKVLQSASVALKEDFAPFEIEWILQTLLFEPIAVFDTISSKRNDNTWSKAIENSFKLLTELVDKYPETLQLHYEEIVTLCFLSYDAQTRKHALQCLSAVARHTATGARDFDKHLSALEQSSTCRAPLALLIGTICEHHPEVVADHINLIWRIFLNLLDSKKNTDTITSAALQGIAGLFEHFGCDLPTSELNGFYDKMVTELIRMPKCQNVCLGILEHHAGLFRERLARDVGTRALLWELLHSKPTPAVRAVYGLVCEVVDRNILQNIVDNEIQPQTHSIRTQVKYTALRIMSYLESSYNVNVGEVGQIDTQTLEFELRNENVAYDVAEAVSWCIESNLSSSDRLLQTAILFYTNLPTKKVKEIVVYSILKAPNNLRSAAVIFLVTETCLDERTMDKYLPLWRDMFDSNNGKDVVVLEKSRLVFEDFMIYIIFVLEAFLEEGNEKIPEKLSSLLHLTSHILTVQSPEHYTGEYCTLLMSLLVGVGATVGTVRAARAAAGHGATVGAMCELISIDKCRDEQMLCESCLLLIEAPNDVVNVDSVLMALQIIFSRSDVEPKMLSTALLKLETLLSKEIDKLEERIVANIINQVEKLRTRTDMTGKDARILHRDVLMFLGKYGRKFDADNNCDVDENTLIVKVKDSLILSLHNPHEGNTYKINLQRVLQLALIHEEPDALQTLLVIICANLSTRQELTLQLALTRVVRSLSRAHARGASVSGSAIQSAVLMCGSVDCVRGILTYISEEKSPGVRKMLSDALEALLLREPGSSLTESLLQAVAEDAALMLGGPPATKRAGLNITETLLTALKENHSLIKDLLPNYLVLISKTNEIDSEVTFEIAAKIYMANIELLHDSLNDLISLMTTFFDGGGVENKMADIKAYRNKVRMCLLFAKEVLDYKSFGMPRIVEVCLEVNSSELEKKFYVLAEMRSILDFNLDLCRDVLSANDFDISNQLYAIEMSTFNGRFCMQSLLMFMEEYCEVLLELHYEKTIEFLANILINLTPAIINQLHRNIISCLTTFTTELKTLPQKLRNSFEKWCNSLPLKVITDAINKDAFRSEHALIIHSLKIMLNVNLTDLSVLTEASAHIQQWPKILLKLYSNGYIDNYLKSQMMYLSDLMWISLKFVKLTDVKRLILEGHKVEGVSNEKVGLQFCRFFMHIFVDVLIAKPYILVEGDMTSCCILINDVIKYAIKKKCSDVQYGDILELVDQLWPTYEHRTTFKQKHSLLLDMSNLPIRLGPESNPLRWVASVISSDASREDKACIIGVLPGGESYGSCYKQFASSLPTRLSEMSGTFHSSLRAALDALSSCQDLQLLDIVVTLASGDASKGWWDEAIDSCMATIAESCGMEVYTAVFDRCWDGLSLGVCERVLMPLLRYSTAAKCEVFFSGVISRLLRTLSTIPKVESVNYKYSQWVVDCTRALSILQVAFEKILPNSLESPNSPLYDLTKADQSWWLARTVCKLCYSLRGHALCPEGDQVLRDSCRLFHCANYNCFAAAICRQRPGENIYVHLFDAQTWARTVDCDVTYSLKLRSQWNIRTTRQATSVEVTSRVTSHSLSGTASGSLRTRMFARTLSEAPLQYDLIPVPEEQVIPQELQLEANELNAHECSATLTAVFCHVSSMPYAKCMAELVKALTGDLHENVKFILAQAICNSKEELKPHARTLRPALLALVSNTTRVENGRRVLNSLHCDVLNTLLQWPDEMPSQSDHLDAVISALLTTCLENRQRDKIHRSLQDLLAKLLDVYGRVVTVAWSVFETYVQDTSSEAKKTIQLLNIITKSKIHIPELLPTLIAKFESKQWLTSLTSMSKLFGLALACEGVRSDSVLVRFRRVLEQLRRDVGQYVKTLYYVQMGYPGCCSEANFSILTGLVRKLVGADKSKCLTVLSSYIENNTSASTRELFEVVEISELLSGESCVDAMMVVKVGLRSMESALKRRVIRQVAALCSHSRVDARKAAYGVMLEAYRELFKQPPDHASSKRPRVDITTPILDVLDRKDVYTCTVLTCLGHGVSERDDDIAKSVRDGVAEYLYKDNMAVRFLECFTIAVYLPTTYTEISSNKALDLSVCVTALLVMLLSTLRAEERFRRILLRDDPLEIRQSASGPSKLLTMSRSYQGTFRSRTTLTGRRTNLQTPESTAPDINVQIPVDNILDVLLKFAKDAPEVAQTLCVQFAKSLLLVRDSRLDFNATMATELTTILSKEPNELTPLVLELSRVFVEDACKVNGFEAAVEKLRDATAGTEGEPHTKLLYEEMRLRLGLQSFALGVYEDAADVVMEEGQEFYIEDLVSTFGKLSNWNNLTIQQRRSVLNNGLPPLWTNREQFKMCIKDFNGAGGWFAKMLSAYHNVDGRNAMNWLREADRWPRRPFSISAVTEAIEWVSKQEHRSYPCDVRGVDCLAEWAARFMIRSAHLTSVSDDDVGLLSRSHELVWCESASERELSALVLDCVKRNAGDLYESEMLSWLRQKGLALRAMGLERSDSDILKRALTNAETHTAAYMEHATPDLAIGMYKLILQLNNDLNSLTKEKLHHIVEQVYAQSLSHPDKRMTEGYKRSLGSVLELAVTGYDDMWDDVPGQHNSLLSDMSAVISQSTCMSMSKRGMLAAVLLNRLGGTVLSEDTARTVLDTIQALVQNLDEFTLSHLKSHAHLFPSRVRNGYPFMSDKDDGITSKYKRCFQLVCDVEHSLLQYCSLLKQDLRSGRDWENIFDRMKAKIFENPYAGSHFRLLNSYKDRLYVIRDFDETKSFKEKAEGILRNIRRELIQREERDVLRLSQLCPVLARLDNNSPAEDRCLAKLLALPPGVKVVRIHEQVRVMSSIRRPTLLKVTLSSGVSRSFLCKGGERLHADAAALRVLRACAPREGYQVTPLSDDCGLIEYLEDHMMLRSMIANACPPGALDASSNVPRPADSELILAPQTAALRTHETLCSLVPAHSLRSAMEMNSASVDDFIAKKRRFMETLASMTIINWILGVGDRHLENIMYNMRDGAVCCVDWGEVLRYGGAGLELPPARLTRNLLCVSDTTVLESRIQKQLAGLRESHKLLLPIIKLSFKWMGSEFDDKLTYIESIIKGSSLSYTITKNAMEKCDLNKYKEKYAKLLDNVFLEYETKDKYSVEEQVSCLLRQCTDPRILSVTRAGWEPWL